MKNTYQLKVELQVPSQSSDPNIVEAGWRENLGSWGEVVSVEAVALLPKLSPTRTYYVDKHLARYLVNAEKRTGQKWEVVERYKTVSPRDNEYDRALLRAEDGSTARIYYRWYSRCWVMGQKVLKDGGAK